MGFWDKVKTFIGPGKPGEGEPKKDEPTPAAKPQTAPAATTASTSGKTSRSSTSAGAVSTFSSSGASAAPAPKPKKDKPKDPYDASGILGLSADELRKRALKIDPYRTAWIGRVDTIPPQSDERTALIDRGLILRGLLSEEQIEEIHRIGDLWLEHHEAASLASTVARKRADQAIDELKKEKAAKKAEKKRLSAERKKKHATDVARRKAEDIIFGAGCFGKTCGSACECRCASEKRFAHFVDAGRSGKNARLTDWEIALAMSSQRCGDAAALYLFRGAQAFGWYASFVRAARPSCEGSRMDF